MSERDELVREARATGAQTVRALGHCNNCGDYRQTLRIPQGDGFDWECADCYHSTICLTTTDSYKLGWVLVEVTFDAAKEIEKRQP